MSGSKIERRLGYIIETDGISSVRCALEDFLKNCVGRNFNWLSIIISGDLNLLEMKVLHDALKRTRKNFLEIEIINADLTKISEIIYYHRLQADRLILSFKSDFNEDALKRLIDDFLIQDVWVETKGAPYCKTYIEHVWENYNRQGQLFDKDARCNGCIFVDACKKINTNGFASLIPIKESKIANDFFRFVSDQ